MKIKHASYGDFSKITDFLTLIFPEDDPKYYIGFLYNDQLFNPDRVFYIEEDNRVVSVLWSIPRIFKDGDSFVFSVGIANVGTHPEYRGKGYATTLMKYVISLAHTEGANFVILVTGIPEYYRKYGFFNIGRNYVTINNNDVLSDVSIRVANIEDVVEVSNSIYCKLNLIVPLRNYSTLKSSLDWNRFSSHFVFKDSIANWYEITDSDRKRIFVYGVEKEKFYEVFEIVFNMDLDVKDVKLLLNGLSFVKKKSVRIFAHRSLLKKLKLNYEDDNETVMCLEIKTIDLNRLFLPVTDYF